MEENTEQPSALSQAAEARRAVRTAALEAAVQAVAGFDDSPEDDEHAYREATVAMRDALTGIIEAFSPKGRASKGPRETLEKAGFEEVGAYFAQTGLTRKELASAAGVSTSVIATVQNEKGDRWSASTFAAKRELIDRWMVDHADEIKTRQDADAAAEQAKAAKAAAKLARQTAAMTKSAQSAQAPKASGSKAKGKTSAKKPGRPSPARRAANKQAPASAAVPA